MQENSDLCDSVLAQGIAAPLTMVAFGHKIMMSGVLTELNSHFAIGLRLRDISGVTIRHKDGQVLQTFDQQLALGAVLTPQPNYPMAQSVRYYTRHASDKLRNRKRYNCRPRGNQHLPLATRHPPQSWSLGFSLKPIGKAAALHLPQPRKSRAQTSCFQ